jgi:hypothetical protein
VVKDSIARCSAAPSEAAVSARYAKKALLAGAPAAAEVTTAAITYAASATASELAFSAPWIAGAEEPTQLILVSTSTSTSTAITGRIAAIVVS